MAADEEQAEQKQGPSSPPFAPQRLLLLIALACLAGGFAWLQMQRPPTAMQVQATQDIAAYSLVASSAVTLTAGSVVPGSIGDLSAAAGRLTLAEIKRGTVITRALLLPAPAAAADWLIVRLPLTNTMAFAPGQQVILYGAAGDGGAAQAVTDQALVIAATADSLTVAAPPQAVQEALGYAAAGRLFAVQRVR